MGNYEIDGESCWFVTHERMLEGLENNDFLDVDEHDNYLFGTTIESVRNVMLENKLCILDVRPEVGKLMMFAQQLQFGDFVCLIFSQIVSKP